MRCTRCESSAASDVYKSHVFIIVTRYEKKIKLLNQNIQNMKEDIADLKETTQKNRSLIEKNRSNIENIIK
ncbi:hypothetical protein ACISOS_08610 [Campylobacter jejuni]